MMSTQNNNNANEEIKNNAPQVPENAQQAENTQPAQQTEEVKDPLHKRVWNKVKKPLTFVAVAAGAFAGGMAVDHFVVNKDGSNQDCSADGNVQPTEDSAQ